MVSKEYTEVRKELKLSRVAARRFKAAARRLERRAANKFIADSLGEDVKLGHTHVRVFRQIDI